MSRVTASPYCSGMAGSFEFSLACDETGPTHRSYWVVPGRFAAGAYPGKRERGSVLHVEALEELFAAGIDRFVNLTQDRPGGNDEHLNRYDSLVDGRGLIRRFEIPDVDIPTVSAMVEILDAIDADLADGHSPYVHCWAGIGRTGTTVGCWLIRHGYATPDNALDVLAVLRQGDIGAGHRRAPETREQCDFVEEWAPGQ